MNVRPLTPQDRDAARALLAASELPTDDLEDPAVTLLGGFDGDDLVGVIGLQGCGDAGLLRSLAVAAAHRDRGIARRLCERLIELAKQRSMQSLWLLTTTARDYFLRHGFEVVPRERTAPAIQATAQFSSLCPSTAVVMRRSLD